MNRHVILVGAGNIGSHAAPHLARMPGVDRVTVIDRDVYEEGNLAGQDIVPGDVGKAKAAVQARRIRRINPAMSVEGVHAPVEDVPLGRLRGDLIVAGLDSRRARVVVNRAAWRLGVPWIDAGVDGAQGLVRVNTYLPGNDRPCLECGWSEADYRELDRVYPCDDARNRAASTGAPSGLGALAASVQALEAAKLLFGKRTGAAGRQVLFDTTHLKYHLVSYRRRPDCRLGDHEPWRIDRVGVNPRSMRLGELRAALLEQGVSAGAAATTGTDSATGAATTGTDAAAGTAADACPGPANHRGPWSLRVPDRRWATRLICSACGASRPTLRLATAAGIPAGTCSRCRGSLRVTGFDLEDELDLNAISPADARRSLRAVGIRTGDVLSIRSGRDAVRHLEVADTGGGERRREHR